MAGVVGLSAAIDYLKKRGEQKMRIENLAKLEKLINALSQLPLELYGNLNPQNKTTALAFNPHIKVVNKSSQELFAQLKKRKIHISYGFLCSPWSHEVLGTSIRGVFRISPGVMNDEREIDVFIQNLSEILS